jgi:hypothetical protein
LKSRSIFGIEKYFQKALAPQKLEVSTSRLFYEIRYVELQGAY